MVEKLTKNSAVKMDSLLQQPKPLQHEGDMASNWKKFRKSFSIYMIASNAENLTATRKVNLLLHIIGEEAQELFDNLGLTNDEMTNVDTVLDKFENYYVPKTNVSVERHKFNSRLQQPGETFDSFYADLVKLAASCNYGDIKDDLIKDRIICGLCDKTVKNRLLLEENLTLERTIKVCRAAVEAQSQLKELNMDLPTTSSSVVLVKQKPRDKNNYKSNKQGNKNYSCLKSGYSHNFGRCPASGKVCKKCGKQNHFSQVCCSGKASIKEVTEPSDYEEDQDDVQEFRVNLMTFNQTRNTWTKDLYVRNLNK